MKVVDWHIPRYDAPYCIMESGSWVQVKLVLSALNLRLGFHFSVFGESLFQGSRYSPSYPSLKYASADFRGLGGVLRVSVNGLSQVELLFLKA